MIALLAVHRRAWRHTGLVCGFMIAAVSLPTRADGFGSHASVSTRAGRFTQALPQSFSSDGAPVTAFSSNEGSMEGFNGTAAASAEARLGLLRASALVLYSQQAGRGGDTDSPQALASASWNDFVTITAPGLNGAPGMWNGTLHLDGLLHAAAEGMDAEGSQAYVRTLLTLEMPGILASGALIPCGTRTQSQVCTGAAALSSQSSGPDTMDAVVDQDVAFSIPITFGQPIPLSVVLGLKAELPSGCLLCNANASSTFVHTLRWGGTTSVASSGAVSNFTLTSASGFDYTMALAVPEPPVGLLWLSGLPALAWLRARRR